MIKKYLAAVVGLLVLPGLTLAANEVTLTTDTVITTGGVTFNISGSSATLSQIQVDGSNIILTLDADSSVAVSTADYSRIGDNASAANISSSTCVTGQSTKTYTATSNVVITLYPNSVLCSSGGGYTSSGGGSTGGYVPTVTPVATTTTTVIAPAVTTPVVTTPVVTQNVPAVVNANPSPVAMAVSPVFNRGLSLGQIHSDAKRLQQLLNSDPDTMVAKSGVGSLGKETTKFGPATVAAVKKFQVKYGVAKPGQAGYGLFGPATRAKMVEVFGDGVTASSDSDPASGMSSSAKLELIKALLAKIVELQAQLKAMQ